MCIWGVISNPENFLRKNISHRHNAAEDENGPPKNQTPARMTAAHQCIGHPSNRKQNGPTQYELPDRGEQKQKECIQDVFFLLVLLVRFKSGSADNFKIRRLYVVSLHKLHQ